MCELQGQTVELDLVGQFYASIISREQSCVFAVSAYLKEHVQPIVLQQAVNDLMRRLPFLNGRLKRGFFHYKYEFLAEPPQVKPSSEEPLFCDFFSRGSGHMISVSYGERHFTVQTTHVACDGRSLAKLASALLVRYFKILGVESGKNDVINCTEFFRAEEAENAYERYVKRPVQSDAKPAIKAYRYKSSKSAKHHVLTQVFDAGKLKEVSRSHNATITEFILMQIFRSIAKERDAKKDKRPITALIPIDCRSFLPSKTLRSFVSGVTITMPETNDASQSIQQIKLQLSEKINKDAVLKDISEIQNMYHSARYVPRILKKVFMKIFARSEASNNTTGFSNVGPVKLPREVEDRVEQMEFLISLEHDSPYFFSCITVGDALALTTTFRDEGRFVAETVMEAVKSRLG